MKIRVSSTLDAPNVSNTPNPTNPPNLLGPIVFLEKPNSKC